MNRRRRLAALGAVALALPLAAATATAASAATQPPVVTVTVGHHTTYDRVTFRINDGGTGAPTNYSVSYASTIGHDASGSPVTLLGNYKIHVVLHDILSAPAGLPGAFQGDIRPGFPQLREVKGAGDFEGVVSYGVGVTSRTTFRVSTLSNPSRLVLDLPIAASSAGSGTLPKTGASGVGAGGVGALASLGLALLVAGALTLVAAARRT